METTIQKLIETGLSEKEAAVYYAGLVLGPTTVLRLSKQSNLKRATVYTVVDSLVHKGLMRIDESGFKKVFVAENPNNLKRVVEQKMTSATEIIPDLTTLYKKSGQERIIKTYEGLSALEGISERLMSETKMGDFRYLIGSSNGWEGLKPKVQEKYFNWRARVTIDAKLLLQSSKRAELHTSLASAFKHKVKVLPKQMKLNADILITPKILVLAKLSEPISAVVIEDPDIIESYKELFLYMWEMS